MAAATRSQAERLWLVGGGLLALLLLVLGYLLFIGPQRSETSSVNSSLSAVQLQNTALQTRITVLQQQSRNATTVKSKLAAAQQALPRTSGLSDFLRTLQSLGTTTSAHVVSLSVGAPTDVSAVAAGTSGTAGTAGTSAATTASPSPAASSSAGTAPAGSTAANSGASVYGLTITAQVGGSAASLNQFLRQLQAKQPRAVLITQITEGNGLNAPSGAAAGGAAASGTTLQLTMQAFVAPGTTSEGANLAAASGH